MAARPPLNHKQGWQTGSPSHWSRAEQRTGSALRPPATDTLPDLCANRSLAFLYSLKRKKKRDLPERKKDNIDIIIEGLPEEDEMTKCLSHCLALASLKICN